MKAKTAILVTCAEHLPKFTPFSSGHLGICLPQSYNCFTDDHRNCWKDGFISKWDRVPRYTWYLDLLCSVWNDPMELYGTHRNSISLEVSAVAMHGTPVCAGVVITGGAAGVGFAYADEFLARGHQAHAMVREYQLRIDEVLWFNYPMVMTNIAMENHHF